ncbi:MAG: MBL fold metallo-hydrolase, partial [bacterium]|nr:MBL fold metallo-hydrolase [bacterium]
FYSEAEQLAFVGDTIFRGSIGSTQYPGSNKKDLQASIFGKIFSLPEKTILYSGHSDFTTVGIEKARYI